MEWWQAVDLVRPHVVQISTPRGFGSGFFLSSYSSSGISAVATAAHVVSDSNWWEEPIRLHHPSSGEFRILRAHERAIHFEYAMDTAAIIFAKDLLPFPQNPIQFIPDGCSLKVGNQIGWLGFPVVSQYELCFFNGQVSSWSEHDRRYLVDGVAINGVSGGPAFALDSDSPVLIGVMSAYIPNYSPGAALPGLSVVRDVKQFQELTRQFQSLEEATREQEPPRPPESSQIASRSIR